MVPFSNPIWGKSTLPFTLRLESHVLWCDVDEGSDSLRGPQLAGTQAYRLYPSLSFTCEQYHLNLWKSVSYGSPRLNTKAPSIVNDAGRFCGPTRAWTWDPLIMSQVLLTNWAIGPIFCLLLVFSALNFASSVGHYRKVAPFFVTRPPWKPSKPNQNLSIGFEKQNNSKLF